MSRGGAVPFTAEDGSVRLHVRVTARAARSAIAGQVDVGGGRTALSVRLAAPPVAGAANRALVAFLASWLGVSGSAVRIVAGEKSRLKTVAVAGLDLSELAGRLPVAAAPSRP